jgi:hypothetical protein
MRNYASFEQVHALAAFLLEKNLEAQQAEAWLRNKKFVVKNINFDYKLVLQAMYSIKSCTLPAQAVKPTRRRKTA